MVDQMLAIEAADELGIRVVGITYESGGTRGADYPLLHFTPSAKHLVSVGNREARIRLEEPERLLGANGAAPVDDGVAQYDVHLLGGEVTVPLFSILGGASQVGAASSQGYPA